MPAHLYCLLPASSKLAVPTSPAIRVLGAGKVAAWIADAGAPQLSLDVREAARGAVEHDRVVGAALRQGTTPVPALLADPYDNDASAVADVVSHESAIVAALGQVQGMVEMTVIIAITDSPPSSDVAGRGRAYLEQLRSVPERATAIADRVSVALMEVGGVAHRRAEGGRVGLSHLVERARVDDYRGLAQSQIGAGYRVVIDGPRAPYSFARFSPRHGILTGEATSKA